MSRPAASGRRPPTILAALTIAVFMVGAPIERVFAWGSGGGGGGGGGDTETKKRVDAALKDLAKNIADSEVQKEKEKMDRKRIDPERQRNEDKQYKPGFAFGPGGDMDLNRR